MSTLSRFSIASLCAAGANGSSQGTVHLQCTAQAVVASKDGCGSHCIRRTGRAGDSPLPY